MMSIVGYSFLFFLISLILFYAFVGLRIAHRRRKVDLKSIDREKGGFLVTHGMVTDNNGTEIESDSDYSESFYRSLAD